MVGENEIAQTMRNCSFGQCVDCGLNDLPLTAGVEFVNLRQGEIGDEDGFRDGQRIKGYKVVDAQEMLREQLDSVLGPLPGTVGGE